MKKVVVIGGGFAGSFVAKELEKKFKVVLIDTKSYFEFTPGILRTIVEPEHIRKIQVLHTHYLRKTKVLVGEVKDLGKDYVKVGKKKLGFDYLVVSSGSSYNLPFKEQRVVTATRAKHLRDSFHKLKEAKRIVIVGGGLVGVEMAGEICYKYGMEKDVTIVHSKGRLIERNALKASQYVEKFFRKRGVKIIFDDKVVDVRRNFCVTEKGRKLDADVVFLSTGIKPNYDFMKRHFSKHLNESGFVIVNEFLQVNGLKNFFVAGDISDRKEEKTAQNAERQGEVVAHNICCLEGGGKLEKYEARTGTLIISLGKHNGLCVHGGFVFGGKIPAFLKWFIERREMGRKRKFS